MITACAAVLLLLSGCKQSSATRHTEQFIPVTRSTRVEVTVTTGYISVAAGRTGMVSLKTFRKVRSMWNAEAKLKHIQVQATKKDGVLSIVGKNPPSDSSQKYHMHLTVTVPPSTPLVLKTHHGHINLTNLLGDVQASTKRGELTARGITGRLTLTTGEGNITLRGAPRQFTLRTRLGDVKIWLRPETQLVGKNEASTESGALTLHASTKLQALVTARATAGTIESAFPRESKRPQWAQMRLGRGGPPISLSCHKGNLRLKKW